jgi:hypothetical protein
LQWLWALKETIKNQKEGVKNPKDKIGTADFADWHLGYLKVCSTS